MPEFDGMLPELAASWIDEEFEVEGTSLALKLDVILDEEESLVAITGVLLYESSYQIFEELCSIDIEFTSLNPLILTKVVLVAVAKKAGAIAGGCIVYKVGAGLVKVISDTYEKTDGKGLQRLKGVVQSLRTKKTKDDIKTLTKSAIKSCAVIGALKGVGAGL